MVLIIDGEIVADSDPRAVARRNPKPQATAAPRGANIQSVGGGGGGPQQRPAGAGGSPLDALASAIGIQGQTIEVPGIAGRIPARQVPAIFLLLLAAATLFFGWQCLAVAALLHVVSGLSEQPAVGPGGRPRAPRPDDRGVTSSNRPR